MFSHIRYPRSESKLTSYGLGIYIGVILLDNLHPNNVVNVDCLVVYNMTNPLCKLLNYNITVFPVWMVDNNDVARHLFVARGHDVGMIF